MEMVLLLRECVMDGELLPKFTSGLSCSFWQEFPSDSCSIILLFSASQLQISYSFQSEHIFFPEAVSHSFAFPSFARKWPSDQSFSELCLNRCNTKNWNQILLIAHVKGRKTILASQLPALRRPAPFWEDKRKSLQPQQHFLSFCFLFILPFYHDRENL